MRPMWEENSAQSEGAEEPEKPSLVMTYSSGKETRYLNILYDM